MDFAEGENYSAKVSEAASDVASSVKSGLSSVTSSKKKYPAPPIPNTPSATINDMLEERCGHSFDNPVKYGIAFYIAQVFTFITKLYEMIHKETTPSHTMWMAACAGVSAVIVLKVVIVYQILIASAFLIHFLLYYVALALVLFGIGLGVSGAVFFDKSTGRAATGFAEKTKTTVRRTVNQVQSEYTKSE